MKPSKKKIKELEKAVKNYNARVKTAQKNNPYLKDIYTKLSIKDVKQRVNSNADINQEINLLKKFNQYSARAISNDEGVIFTNFDVIEINTRVEKVNRERAKQRKRTNENNKIFPSDRIVSKVDEGLYKKNKKVEIKKIKTSRDLYKQLLSLRKQSSNLYFNKRAEQYKENYFSALMKNYSDENKKKIAEALEKIDSSLFYSLSENNPIFEVGFHYDQIEENLKTNEIVKQLNKLKV